MVKLEMKAAGSTRRRFLDVEPPVEVSALREIVAAELKVNESRLRLVFRGKPLQRREKPCLVDVQAGESLFVVVAPEPPPLHVQNRDEEDEEDLRFMLPDGASATQRRLVRFMKEKLRIPDLVLVVIFSISWRTWFIMLGWCLMAKLASHWQIGPIYIIVTIFCLIFFNLGKRQEGELSAYSIFNEGFRELPGTLNAERIDRDIRAGRL